MVDVLALAGQRRFDGQRLDVDVGLHQRSQLRRQRTDRGRLDAVLVDQTGHFDATARRQVVDQPAVRYIAVDDTRLAGLHTVDDA